MGDHKRSARFKDDSFNIELLEESSDRNYICEKEEYYIKLYDTFNNGLNDTISGKGYGHSSKKFTTFGYIFSEESRVKMSTSAKDRCVRDKDLMSTRSKKLWLDKEYLEKQSGKRQGKRLRPPKLSDEQVVLIRQMYEKEKEYCILEIKAYNIRAEKLGLFKKTPAGFFANKYKDEFNVTNVTIRNIVEMKCRVKILPSIYKS